MNYHYHLGLTKVIRNQILSDLGVTPKPQLSLSHKQCLAQICMEFKCVFYVAAFLLTFVTKPSKLCDKLCYLQQSAF